VSWLTADANSRFSFTCDVPGVVVDFGAGAEGLYALEVPNMAIAAGGATNTAIDARMKWSGPGTVYALNQQVISPNGDVVKANVAHTSAAAYATDVAKWVLSATFAPKSGLDISVWDFGAVGDGTADDSTALQSFITACGVGNKVKLAQGTFGQKKFKCLSGLTLLDFQTLEGTSNQLGLGANGYMEIRFPSFTAAEQGLTLAASNTIRDVILRGPGTTIGTCVGVYSGSGSPHFERAQFLNWATGVSLVNSYYGMFTNCEWSRNKVGLLLAGCTNTNLYAPKFYCGSDNGINYGTAISTNGCQPLNIFGGSIEAYGPFATPGIVATGPITLGLYSVYWESSVSGVNAIGVVVTGANLCSVNAVGNYVNMTEHNRWLYASNVNTSVVGHGNHFSCAVGSSTAPYAYYLAAGQEIELSGDYWQEVLKAGSSYTSMALPAAGMSITPPTTAPNAGKHFAKPTTFPVGTTTAASVTIPHGAAPTSPANGDMWTTTAGLFVRINGATVGPLS